MARLATLIAATVLAGATALPALAQQPVISVPGVAPAAPAPSGPIAPSIPDIYSPPAAAKMLDATAPDAASIGAQVVNLLTQVCVPLVHNGAGDMKAIAKQVGLKMYRGAWTMRIDKLTQVQVTPPTLANPNLCRMQVNHPPETRDQLINGMAYWAKTQQPELKQLSNGYYTDSGPNRVFSWSWYADTPTEQTGLAYSETKINGQPEGKGFDIGRLQYSITKK
jgi:hypothetical protein